MDKVAWGHIIVNSDSKKKRNQRGNHFARQLNEWHRQPWPRHLDGLHVFVVYKYLKCEFIGLITLSRDVHRNIMISHINSYLTQCNPKSTEDPSIEIYLIGSKYIHCFILTPMGCWKRWLNATSYYSEIEVKCNCHIWWHAMTERRPAPVVLSGLC